MAFGTGPLATMKTRATYEDLLAVSDDKPFEAVELELAALWI